MVTRASRLKILSIRQPWAHLIVSGVKDIENRTWRTGYRGLVLIHASRQVRTGPTALALDAEPLQTGGVVGLAEIVDCVTQHHSRWFEGPYGFVLRNARSIPFIKWRGALGLCEAPIDLQNKLNFDG